MKLLELEDIVKSFPSPAGGSIEILSGVSLSLEEAEVVSVVGKSGSGKSTLLSIAALLSAPDCGRVIYSGLDALSMKENEIDRLRATAMGFVFQSSQLLKDFSALENVAMPLMIQGKKRKEAFSAAKEFLSLTGLEDRAGHRPPELSGGERQRVAIARALAGNPSVIFADEPTGALDEKNASLVEDLLFESVKKTGHCMLLVTHDPSFASRADKCFELREGVLCGI
ncbi:MAG: ABC transporter ATP-binding protein [Spirochaetes bacterium]|uniref:ABC transporter ATP-binding protein n=1 Tax=Candidatus Ornithospirochaeta stercoripullorum TaxID=2840899 RepID=A0A9D9H523_9SPIO|nr:ABC transporter ATP-binding protein [Candidatus Ornithospirochaeta stercoripullorum]